MRHAVKALVILLLVGLAASLMGQISPSQRVIPARAEAPTITPTPQVNSRRMVVPVSFIWYDWWMVRWENNEVICRILIEHEGQPTSPEIQYACGNRLFAEWRMTKPCNLSNIAFCRGMYMHFVRSFPGKRNTEVILPQPKVWISLVDCNPAPTVNRCTDLPSLMLTGEELLPSEMIVRIQGTFAGEPFSCPGEACLLPMRPTGTQGVELEFWGDSSFGDSSEHYKALVRVTAQGDIMSPDGQQGDVGEWYVDVLSPQWREGTLASCSDTWQVFPDIGGPPAWLNTPVKLEDMLSTRSYYYLAGKLITNGEVNPEGCPDGGLIGSMIANQCGLEKALPQVIDWQNRFDTEIMKVSKDTGVPAQLLKNIFGRESQFWPGLYKDINEAGLGQLTEKGADTLLMWNTNFYQNFCPLVLSGEACQNGYVFLKPVEQNLLRGALVSKVNAACPTCPVGIDLTQAEFSVRVFAESLLANCSQTSRVVTNVTNKAPGQVSSFVDMWKFTLVNYNAGTGCLWNAMSASYRAGERLDWKNVSARLDSVCKESVQYVDAISGGQPVVPTPTAWVFGGTPLPPPVFPTAPRYTPTPQSTATITPTNTVSATPTGMLPSATRVSSSPTPTRTATRSAGSATPTATQSPTRAATVSGYPNPASITPPSYP